MACSLPVTLNTDTGSITFRLFNLFRESIAFLTSYSIVSKWRLETKRNKSFFFFFPLAKYGAAGQRGRSCYFHILT